MHHPFWFMSILLLFFHWTKILYFIHSRKYISVLFVLINLDKKIIGSKLKWSCRLFTLCWMMLAVYCYEIKKYTNKNRIAECKRKWQCHWNSSNICAYTLLCDGNVHEDVSAVCMSYTALIYLVSFKGMAVSHRISSWSSTRVVIIQRVRVFTLLCV